jgi:hypothetical protein
MEVSELERRVRITLPITLPIPSLLRTSCHKRQRTWRRRTGNPVKRLV